MFVKYYKPNYDINKEKDISIYNGIPKQFYNISNKEFSEWEIPPWNLIIFEDKLLGEGSFAKVYLAKWRETYVAAKVINLEILNTKKFLVLRELDIMSKLHHPNIVQFLGYIDEPFIIIMEYIPKSNLQKNISFLTKYQKINIMRDILKALAYIHNRQPSSLIHRDIKPTNILLTKSKTAKISDFGLSKYYNIFRINSHNAINQLDNNQIFNTELTNNVGTERYMSPEQLANLDYTHKTDIYSCGILLYEMFENKKYTLHSKISYFWTPKKIRLIINNMLDNNPENRNNALTILKNFKYK
jgi:serine/threonine protein kinase